LQTSVTSNSSSSPDAGHQPGPAPLRKVRANRPHRTRQLPCSPALATKVGSPS
jgi:hypothetical protein